MVKGPCAGNAEPLQGSISAYLRNMCATKKCEMSGTGYSCAVALPRKTEMVFLNFWGVREGVARPFTSGAYCQENARLPDWPATSGANIPSLSLRLEYYDRRPSAQPTSLHGVAEITAVTATVTTFRAMIAPLSSLPVSLAEAVSLYEATGNVGGLMEQLHQLRDGVTPDALIAAAEPFLHMPEVVGPLYERVVDEQPSNARALVILANAYWLSGRGPELVGDLANRALASDPNNKGAWHLWALTESNQRDRTIRWLQITERFPTDLLAKAALADNAASLAASEHDKEALAMAIGAYEELWANSPNAEQRAALETALKTLRNYKL